jgi:hypothetical protein
MSELLIPSTFLFRFSVACLPLPGSWSDEAPELDESHRLPSFGELEGRPVFADLRAAWCREGLAFTLRVAGKRQPAWCRETRVEESDGLHLWIDTRDTHNIHRAGRFCHRLAFLPTGSGRALDHPSATQVAIHRARENPKPCPSGSLSVHGKLTSGGYELVARIAASALTGYNPTEHDRLGFTYAIVDRELGWQTFSVGPELPFMEDPSLWGTLELVAP